MGIFLRLLQRIIIKELKSVGCGGVGRKEREREQEMREMERKRCGKAEGEREMEREMGRERWRERDGEREGKEEMRRDTERHFKELAHVAREGRHVQNLQHGQAGRRHKEELILQLESKDSLRPELPFSQETSVSFLLRPSTDWTRPTHIIAGNLLYSKSTDLNINLIFKTLSRQHPCHMSGDHGLAKRTCKMNHHCR